MAKFLSARVSCCSAIRRRAWIEALESRQLLSAAVPHFDHIVVVVEENHTETSIIGSTSAPYMNSLAANGAQFTNSFAITHPSQPNYLALFSGSTQGSTNDTPPVAPYTTPNLGAELLAAGDTFAGYSESMPSVGYLGVNSGQYYRKHNPWADWQSSTPGGNLLPASVNQPFTSFPGNFAALPAVSFVVPNQLNDMHDGTIAMADSWLQTNIQPYAVWAKTHNSLLIVTWDEDDTKNANRIPTIFYGANVSTAKYAETINHYGVLRTIEDADALPHAGASATATPITDVWSVASTPTATTTALSSSVATSTYGQSVTFTATVKPVGAGIPSGAVQFQIDGNNAGSAVTLAGGVAHYSTVKLSAGVHSVTASYIGNTSFSASAGSLSFTVARRAVAGTVTISNKIYDGTTTATILSRTLTGVVTGDAVSMVGGVATFADNNVGTNKRVTITGLMLGGASSANYFLSNPTEFAAASITRRSLTVTANSFKRVHGQPNPLLTGKTSGLIATDGISYALSVAAGQFSPAGVYAITPVLSDPKHRLSNYVVTIVKGALTIAHAGTTVTAHSLSAKHGTEIISLTAMVAALSPSRDVVGDGHITFHIVNKAGTQLKIINSAAPVKGLATAKVSVSGLAVGSYAIIAVYVPNATYGDFNTSTTAHAATLTIT